MYAASSDGTVSCTDLETGISSSLMNLNPSGWQVFFYFYFCEVKNFTLVIFLLGVLVVDSIYIYVVRDRNIYMTSLSSLVWDNQIWDENIEKSFMVMC